MELLFTILPLGLLIVPVIALLLLFDPLVELISKLTDNENYEGDKHTRNN